MARSFYAPLLAALALLAGGAPAQAPDSGEASLHAMQGLYQRMVAAGHRLAAASRDLCADREWLPGFALHDRSQYDAPLRPAASRIFGFDAGAGVLALAPGGPAERAGLRVNDLVLGVDGRLLPREAPAREGGFVQMERMLAVLDEGFADGRAELAVQRGGERLIVAVQAEQGCASRFQLVEGRRRNARADGRYVQITTAIAAYVASDEELAAVLAHELAHNVLRHRARLDAANVSRGFFGNFGRNARLIRETEVEADRLGVYLLERAGYDPEAMMRFYTRFGRSGLNFLGSATHPNWGRRVATLRAEIALIRSARAAGRVPNPAFLAPLH
jgi:beta-barrel assembly-enhancing protease